MIDLVLVSTLLMSQRMRFHKLGMRRSNRWHTHSLYCPGVPPSGLPQQERLYESEHTRNVKCRGGWEKGY